MNSKYYILSSFLFFCMVGAGGQKPELVVQTGHLDGVSSIAISPNGQYVLTGSYDNTAKLWNQSGQELQTFLSDGFAVNSVAFSPDGQYVLVGSDDTAKLWSLKGQELQSFMGHSSGHTSVAFSPDGQYVLTGGYDNTARLWDLKGRELQSFNGHLGQVNSAIFSPDGQYVLTGSGDRTAKLWNLEGQELQGFMGHSSGLTSVAFSPDGQYLLTGSEDRTAKLWTLKGQELQSFNGHLGPVNSAIFSPDGQFVLTGSDDNTARLWDLKGQELQSFTGHPDFVLSAIFAPNGQYVLTGSYDNTAKSWSLSGEELQSYMGHLNKVYSATFSPDGQYLLTGNGDKTAKLWGLSDQVLHTFTGHSDVVFSAAFSPDGPYVLTGSGDNTAKLWGLSGKELHTFKGHFDPVSSVAFSPDGQYVLTTGSTDNTAILWDLKGNELQSFTGHSGIIYSGVFSPGLAAEDSSQAARQYILTCGGDGTAKLWGLNGQEVQSFPERWAQVRSAAFSPDGPYVLTGSGDNTAKLWSLAGQKLQTFKGHLASVESVAFSPDGQFVLTGSDDDAAILWALNGQELQIFTGHSNDVTSAVFSPDRQHILTSSLDGAVKLWKMDSGQLVASLYGFTPDNGWAVTTPDGHFDGDEAGLQNIHYVVGLEAIELDRLKERYYEPGLFSKLMGFNKEPLRDVTAFDYVALYPAIELNREDDQLMVTLTERSGGMGRTALYINGSEKIADLNPDRSGQFTINLEDYQVFYYAKQSNTIGVKSYNEEGWLGSSLHTIEYHQPQPSGQMLTLNVQPHIYALCIGTADYARGTTLDLAYAEQDAQRLARAVELGGEALLNDPGRVEVLTLTTCLDQDCPDAQRPTKKNIRAALVAFAQKSRPEDVFLLYLSGHGKVYQDYFYYLTQDMGSDYLGDDAIRAQYAISSAEFAEWLNAIPARKQVMMIDACASGQFNEDMALLAMKDIPGSQIRALDRLRDRTGIFIISGSANDQASYEASPYGMGLLTYSLLTGMSGGALREEEYMDVEKLFSFAEEQVPVLAEDVGAIQTPKYWKPEGSKSFDIGRATKEVKEKIQLPSPKPVFVRARFINNETFGDELKLEATLNALMRDFALAKGQDKVLLFVDADDHPNAYRLSGRYTLEGGMVRVEFSVFKGDKAIGERLTLETEAADLEALGRKVIARAYAMVRE